MAEIRHSVSPNRARCCATFPDMGDQSNAAPWRAWYRTARWRKLRWAILVRDLFTCQMPGCGRLEGDTSQLVADHIRPHRGDERLFWDETNLQTLCAACHNRAKQVEEQASLHQRGVWH